MSMLGVVWGGLRLAPHHDVGMSDPHSATCGNTPDGILGPRLLNHYGAKHYFNSFKLFAFTISEVFKEILSTGEAKKGLNTNRSKCLASTRKPTYPCNQIRTGAKFVQRIDWYHNSSIYVIGLYHYAPHHIVTHHSHAGHTAIP